MKHTVLGLLLAAGLLAPGCAHGRGSSRAHELNGKATLVLLGVGLAGAALLAAGISSGSQACKDPLGRCGSYDLPPPESP